MRGTGWPSRCRIGNEPVIVEVMPGQSLTAVSARACRPRAGRGIRGCSRCTDALVGADSRMHAGEFSIAPGTSPQGLLQAFVSGAVVQHSVTIVEGWTFRELRRTLAREPTLESTLRGLTRCRVMRKLGEEGRHPEGLFFPDTYLFGKGTRDIDVLRQARERMRKELAAAWAAAASGPAAQGRIPRR